MSLRVVLDTNTIVSALVFRQGRMTWLRGAWQRGDLVPLICNQSVSELLRVLSYPKFRLGEGEVFDLLGELLPHAETVSEIHKPAAAPRCRDTEDQIFIDLAFAAHADALITGDADLLSLADDSAVPFLTPAELRQRLITKDRDEKRHKDP